MAAKLPTLTVATPVDPELPLLPAAEQESQGLSINQIVAIVWAHRKIAVLTTVLLAAIFAGAIKLLPKSYDSTATLMVNFDSGDALGESAFPAGYMDSYIATQIEVMQSSPVLVSVINELELTTKEEFTAGFNGQGSLIDWIKAQLLKKLAFRHTGGTQLIYINATSRSATDAALIANTVAKVYLSQLTDQLNKPATERADRYSAQLTDLKNKVNAAQEKVTEFRQANGLTDLNASNADAEVGILNTLESRYQDALNNERAAQVMQSTQQDVNQAATQSMVVQNLRAQLATLQSKLAEYQTTYGPKHPKVIELQSQIDATNASLAKEMQSLSHTSNLQLDTVHSMASKLLPAVQAQRAKVLALRRQQDEGAKLLLELESAQTVYKRALDGYDKVMAAAGGAASNVRLMNSAEVPVKATKPNKMKLMILALAAACFAGFVGPFAYDFLLHRRIRCKDDIERDLAIPILAEFGKISTPAEA